MARKGSSVKWSLPDVDVSSSARTTRTFHGESASEHYSDTFVDLTQSHVYSETFVSDSYSDTFINGSATGTTLSTNGQDKLTNSYTTDDIKTVISAATKAVKTETDKTKNAIEAESVTEAPNTHISEAIETDIETHTSHSEGVDTIYSVSETHPPDTYTDTFESSERTRADITDCDTYSKADTNTAASYTDSFTQSYTDSEQYTQSDDKSQMESYSSYGEKTFSEGYSYTETYDDDYSYTFEPTESSHAPVDPEEILREAETQKKTEEGQKKFMISMVSKLKKSGRQDSGLKEMERLSPEPKITEEDDYLVHYCRKKMKLLRQKKKPGGVSSDDKPHPLLANRPTLIADYGINPGILERAKIRRVMSAMEKAAREEVHDPRQCHSCTEDKARLDTMEAERLFVLSHAKSLQNRIMDRQVEEHLLKMNSVSMIAEIARELPRHAEKPEIIMDRLFEPLLGKNVMR